MNCCYETIYNLLIKFEFIEKSKNFGSLRVNMNFCEFFKFFIINSYMI